MQIPSLRLRIHRLLDGQLQRGRFKRTDCRIQPRHHLLEYHNVSFGAFVSDTWYKREFHSLVHYICMSPAFGQQLLFDCGRWGGHVGVDACSRTVHAGGFSDVYWTMSFGWGHQRKVRIVTVRIGKVWWRVHDVSILSGFTVWIHAFFFLRICSRQKAAIWKELKTTSYSAWYSTNFGRQAGWDFTGCKRGGETDELL